jgi:signal transduction histidine kinase
MNGKIWVQSEVGKGSSFTFEIPFTRYNAEAANYRTDSIFIDYKQNYE